jgi:alpha-tubulin suppressor-like RCC1 family protein
VNVPNPENSGSFIDTEILESQPLVVESLVQEGFRAVKVSAGDSISVALGSTGQLRVWGSFRVCHICFVEPTSLNSCSFDFIRFLRPQMDC